MDIFANNILNNVNQGITIVNESFQILFWNNYMEHITGIKFDKAINKDFYGIFSNFNKKIYHTLFNNVMNNGHDLFICAALHSELINDKGHFNLKITRIKNNNSKYAKCLLFEFIDVTNQFIRIEQFRKYVKKLSILNKQLQEKEKVIKNLAYYDQITGLANRTLFYKIAEKFINNAQRTKNLLGLMFIDVDNFKEVNDTYGHKIGDDLLIHTAKILTESTRKNDLVARFGGDEFLILLPNINSLDFYKVVHSRIIKNKNILKYSLEFPINVSLSIGVSFYPYHGKNIDELILKADNAMYIAKNKLGEDNCFAHF